MEQKPKKRFFQNHAKSSAAVISLGIHVVLLVIALSFVAVTVIQKNDQQFEIKKVNRPKMQLKKLQVPVDIKKKRTQKPRLRKRIVVQPKLQKTPDIKLPEITGVKGGVGNAGDALGGGGGLGFTMPEINIFGLKSRGEKVFLALNGGPTMMLDERGGIPAFTIIKNELISIMERLPATTLINISVFNEGGARMMFPSMQPATAENVEKVKAWLSPLNHFSKGMASNAYGPKTLGPGGVGINRSSLTYIKPLRGSSDWLTPAVAAMEQQADSVYILTDGWGRYLRYKTGMRERNGSTEAERARWQEDVKKAKAMFAEENRQRKAKGLPPKVLRDTMAIVRHYVPSAKPPQPERSPTFHQYTAREVEEGLKATRARFASKNTSRAGIKRGKDKISFNVIHFATKTNKKPIVKFNELTNYLRGDYVQLEGLAEIRFSASAGE